MSRFPEPDWNRALLAAAEGVAASLSVEDLLARGANVNTRGGQDETPLHKAAWRAQDGIVRVLLESGADPGLRTKEGRTPLHWATRANALGGPDVIERLVKCGADPNARDEKGMTPLHWAVLWGNTAGLERLLALGADVEARDGEGRTPLDVAQSVGFGEILRILEAHLRARLREAQRFEFDTLMEMSR